MSTGFAAIHINPQYIKRLQELGITDPSPIQAEAIPTIMEGKDVVAQSQTGTGKTLAYALPLLHKINEDVKEAQGLILAPTRELGIQIVQTLEQLTKDSGIRVQQLIGGASIERQIDKLRLKPHIIVGTPGRVYELVKLRKLKLNGIKTVVVDEVDQVFELGSMNEVEALLKGMLRERQMLFFSATFPAPIQAVIDRWMREPVYVRVNPAQRTSETLEHLYFVCEERDKIDTLRRVVRLYNPKAAIVFINETDEMAKVVEKLKFVGLSAEGLYGEAFKQDRATVMQAFRAGKFQLLVATDVAARGLDLPQVTHVINLDPPIDADHYVHRVGRTGRMGRKGTALSIITPRQQFIIDKFAKTLGIAMEYKSMYRGKILDAGQERRVRNVSKPRVGKHEPASSASALQRERSQSSNGEQSKNGNHPRTTAKVNANGKPSRNVAENKRKVERERDRKNKGAPRWLKEKQNSANRPQI